MVKEKIVGYLLLGIGILIMIFGTISVYRVFTGYAKPFELFNLSGISVSPSNLLGNEFAATDQTANLDLLSAKDLNSTANSLAHLFLMGFIVSTGYKLATLGVNMVRPIIVKVGDKKILSATEKEIT